ncbi:10354_t:CDS:2 [Acaulospora morrowiae]|uniref:10354_t:CDS:1 n=1 Tax=Acaulospora morrowiae TaxID=94023 RepID=A0A9N9H2Q8_9GLOM|nr:10354_t:CDS:2 [Acaulospora morrowiae]
MGKKVVSLPIELVLEIFSHVPTRQLCKFMTLSKTFDYEIRKIFIARFNSIFWNSHRRLLVLMTRYLLDFVPVHNVFDLTFSRFDTSTLMATFYLDPSQPSNTVGPNHSKLWGLKLRGDGILRDNMLNEPLMYTNWDCPTETHDSRIYVFDSETDKEHPFLKSFFVTRGQLKVPTGECGKTNGLWESSIMGKNKHKSSQAKFVGKNELKEDGSNLQTVLGMLNEVNIKATMLLASIEEQTKDRCIGGIRFLVLEGGEEFLKRKKCCTIS